MQDIVVGNKNLTDVTKPSEIVQLLLNDEQLASLESSTHLPTAGGDQNGDKEKQNVVRDMWNDDGDDFFGHTITAPLDRVDDANVPSQGTRGKGRKAGASRGRKPGPKKKGTANTFHDSIH